MSKNQKTSTVAVIDSYKKLLILRRGESAPWMPGRYCLPGGHVEPNETNTSAAIRELNEETGISYPIENLKTITINYSSGYSKTVWIAHVNSNNVSLNWEHDHYLWVSSMESFLVSLVPGLGTTIKTLSDSGHLI
ncbi:NUDIX hydrolase [bacterium]|nr:NUDIX hydrolase [bacterium]